MLDAVLVLSHVPLAVGLGLPIALIQEYRSATDTELELMHSWLDIPSLTGGPKEDIGRDITLAIVFEAAVLLVYTLSNRLIVTHAFLFVAFVFLLSAAEQTYYKQVQERCSPTSRSV